MLTLGAVETRIDQWFRELEPVRSKEDPWIFLCLSVLVDYLSRLATGVQQDANGNEKRPGRCDYIRFIRRHFRPGYRAFTYRCGRQDLPEQMYHVLRCGIVHSFSLVPDPHTQTSGGRERPIVLAHAREANSKRLHHLDQYAGPRGDLDAALFVAEVFFEDVRGAANSLLSEAASNNAVANNVLTWFGKYRPISGDY